MALRRLVWRGGEKVLEDVPFEPVTRLQARLALGPDACAILDAAATDPLIPWAMREAIRSATIWHRNEPEIDELAWLLGLSPNEIDDLFRLALTF